MGWSSVSAKWDPVIDPLAIELLTVVIEPLSAAVRDLVDRKFLHMRVVATRTGAHHRRLQLLRLDVAGGLAVGIIHRIAERDLSST